MRLWAISDLHLASAINREALAALPDHGPDWLVLAGDVAERSEHLHLAFRTHSVQFQVSEECHELPTTFPMPPVRTS